ncbi:hypothetical protein [Amycolatopsis sp. NPDC051903]|uniref:hypothetical protein n=1 Tax=Amycolatopsis sp. NPDC051903 TaxID=3363936 RepID=UPI0037B22EBD
MPEDPQLPEDLAERALSDKHFTQARGLYTGVDNDELAPEAVPVALFEHSSMHTELLFAIYHEIRRGNELATQQIAALTAHAEALHEHADALDAHVSEMAGHADAMSRHHPK